MPIIECRCCGHAIDARDGVPIACPACGAKPAPLAVHKDVPSPERIEEMLRILDRVPDVPAEPGDEIERNGT